MKGHRKDLRRDSYWCKLIKYSYLTNWLLVYWLTGLDISQDDIQRLIEYVEKNRRQPLADGNETSDSADPESSNYIMLQILVYTLSKVI